MKKVFAYVASRKGKESNTYKSTKELLDRLTEIYNDVHYEIITPNMVDIKPCLSCDTCFSKGFCVQDSKDDMKKLKEMMIDADVIIFASPVYAHNVSGDMKIFIDRISHWLHIFQLSNKYSVTVTTSCSNGNIYVSDYLNKMLTAMGATNISNIEVLTEMNDYEKNVAVYADEIRKNFMMEDFFSTDEQEKQFRSLKRIISSYDEANYEHAYWKKAGLLECDTLQEYLLRTAI